MASSCSWLIISIFLFVKITIVNSKVNGCFSSVFSFGDSIADTGNRLQMAISTSTKLPPSAFPPNGRTFFHHPTGRRCDGRLIIDLIAEALVFSFLPPYLGVKNGTSQSSENGVNFAVAGATVLDPAFLVERGIYGQSSNITLTDEMGFFKDFLSSTCSSSSYCKELLRSSLIVMGEIGGVDYNLAFKSGRSIDEVRQIVPLVLEGLVAAINELIDLGAVTIVVPGILPTGCNPSILTFYQGSDKANYDPLTGCLTWVNLFSAHHNELLQKELGKIRKLHPNINLIYGDYFNAATRIYDSPKQFGFKETIKACCGWGGMYNYNLSRSCGYPPVTSCCNNPSSYVNWDGIHFTEAANRIIAREILEELNTSFLVSPNHCKQQTQK